MTETIKVLIDHIDPIEGVLGNITKTDHTDHALRAVFPQAFLLSDLVYAGLPKNTILHPTKYGYEGITKPTTQKKMSDVAIPSGEVRPAGKPAPKTDLPGGSSSSTARVDLPGGLTGGFSKSELPGGSSTSGSGTLP